MAELVTHTWDRIYRLCNRSRLTDTTGLNNDIIKLLELYDIVELLNKVHLQSTADTSILQCNKGIILLIYYSTLFYKVGIDIYFTDIIYDNGKFYTFFIVKNTIEECCLTTSQITCQK